MKHDEVDVIVVGSGAAGLMTACVAADAGQRVVVLERAPLLGGTTAVSGGMIWVPDNPLMPEYGLDDSPADALRYLRQVTEGAVAQERLEQFVEVGAEMVGYLLKHTPVRLFPIDRPDYHSDWDGARDAGRTLDNQPFETASRPGLLDRIRVSEHFAAITYDERHRWLRPGLYDHALVAQRTATGVVTVGRALVAALVAACDERAVRFVTECRAVGLLVEAGRVVGVRTEQPDGAADVRAASVVLSTGGFEWNSRLQEAFLGSGRGVAISPPHNEGDGLVMATGAGAALDNMASAWWVPTVSVPGESYDGMPLSRHLVAERCLPGSIMVNRAGRRFVNEAVNYNDVTKAFHTFDPTRHESPNAPAWLVFDERFRRRYPIASVPAAGTEGGPAPSWFASGGSPAELAARIGIDPAALTATVEAFNVHAAAGVDPEFGRGGSAHDRYYGDDTQEGNPCLGPLTEPPYYAVEVRSGMLGTKGGLVTDLHGRVLGYDGTPVPGLLGCGNVVASVMGPGYPGSGGTLGPALVGGYLCGQTVGEKGEQA